MQAPCRRSPRSDPDRRRCRPCGPARGTAPGGATRSPPARRGRGPRGTPAESKPGLERSLLLEPHRTTLAARLGLAALLLGLQLLGRLVLVLALLLVLLLLGHRGAKTVEPLCARLDRRHGVVLRRPV